jgi:hypothetical protein
MAVILPMPHRARPKGRRRERPIKSAPLAHVVEGTDFREANKPTYEEIRASINNLAHHLALACDACRELFPAYPNRE